MPLRPFDQFVDDMRLQAAIFPSEQRRLALELLYRCAKWREERLGPALRNLDVQFAGPTLGPEATKARRRVKQVQTKLRAAMKSLEEAIELYPSDVLKVPPTLGRSKNNVAESLSWAEEVLKTFAFVASRLPKPHSTTGDHVLIEALDAVLDKFSAMDRKPLPKNKLIRAVFRHALGQRRTASGIKSARFHMKSKPEPIRGLRAIRALQK